MPEPSVISASAGSSSPDPGGMRAIGVVAITPGGKRLTWSGVEWESSESVRIAVIADSMTAQSPLIDEMWPSVMERNFRQSGLPCTVTTYAVNGWTAWKALNTAVYGSKTIYQACVDSKPQVVVVCLGNNEAFGNPDGRTGTQINGDIVTLLTNVRAALPNALIYFADQGVYDSANFTSATVLNKGLSPIYWTLNPSGILANIYTAEILDTAVSTATRDAVAKWDAYVAAARALKPTVIDGFFSLRAWYAGRLGLQTCDRLHPTRLGQAMIAGTAMKALLLEPSFATYAQTFGSQQNTYWIDPDLVFAENLNVSGNGYTSKAPNASQSEAAMRHWSQAARELHPDSWFHPYKAKVRFKPLTTPAGSSIAIASGFYQLQITGAAPLSAVGVSYQGGAFLALGATETTDEAGNLMTVGNMQSLSDIVGATAGAGRLFRFGIGNSSFGPFSVTLT